MNNVFPRNFHHKFTLNKGMTFIEVLIAVFILVTGILGAVAMQATAKKGSFDAMQRSVASALAQDIIERMRSNNSAALAGYAASNYGETLDAVPENRCNTLAGICSPAEMMINDKYEWEMSLMGADVVNDGSKLAGLTGVRGCISQVANAVTVVISWEGRTEIFDGEKNTCGTAGSKRRQVIVEAFIN
ncbi:MAG: hypothetical protein AXW17_03735 [Colwellia sp. Phe_37]|nr:MAG: hypothetical protein AXW17_03735 [Colwellia sp. Phe_37]